MKNIFTFISKRKIILIIFTVLIIGGYFFVKTKSSSAQKSNYQTAAVEKGTIVSNVSASGQVLSSGDLTITTNASGVVKAVYVKNGDQVIVGQKMAEITLDSGGQQRNTQAWSNYLNAQNSLAAANATLYTLQSTMFTANQKFLNDAVARNLATDDPVYIEENATWLASEANYKNQQIAINQNQAAFSNASLAYQASSPVVTAPSSGTITNLNLVPGLVLTNSSSSSSTSSTSTTTTSNGSKVADLKSDVNPLATFNISEIDAVKVNIGQKATLTLDALPNATFTGKVTTIDKSGTVSSGVTNYPVTIQFDTNPENVYPNMSATASIITAVKNDVLLVSSGAVQTSGNQSYVRVLKNGQVQQVPIETGLTSDSQTEIVSGLNEGDQVITGTISTQTSNSQSPFSGNTRFGGGAVRIGGFGGR